MIIHATIAQLKMIPHKMIIPAIIRHLVQDPRRAEAHPVTVQPAAGPQAAVSQYPSHQFKYIWLRTL